MSRFAGLLSWPLPWRRALAVLLLCAAAGLAQAQAADADADDVADPPERVARLSWIAGDLGFLPTGDEEWIDATINRPLTTGDRLSSAPGARAELEFGGGTARIDGNSELGLLDLDDQLAQIELTRGTLGIVVRSLEQGQSYEIDTPVVALAIDRPGRFRVDVGDDGTRVTAFEGSATVYGDNDAQRTVNPGRSYRFGDSALAAVEITDVGAGDAFDQWGDERDRRYASPISSQYVDDGVVGYQDLDQYGDWRDTDEYGAVWFPTQVAADWSPYRDGHWSYIGPWGWTWVDDAPWGFAPYHYGRWAYVRGGWGWIPGPRGVRPVYAPALVAFVGGGGWSVGIGGAPVGWFPLGPGEVYNPWYRCGRSYYTRVNLRNIRDHRGRDHRRDIADHYDRYRRGRPGHGDHYAHRGARGFTAMPGHDFVSGRHVRRGQVRVDPRRLADAPVLARGADHLRPVRDRSEARNAHARSLRAGGFQRQVVARHAPPAHAGATAAVFRPGAALREGTRATGAPPVRLLGSRDKPAFGAGNTRPAMRGEASRQRGAGHLPQVPRITSAASPRQDDAAQRRPVRGMAAHATGSTRQAATPSRATLPSVPRIRSGASERSSLAGPAIRRRAHEAGRTGETASDMIRPRPAPAAANARERITQRAVSRPMPSPRASSMPRPMSTPPRMRPSSPARSQLSRPAASPRMQRPSPAVSSPRFPSPSRSAAPVRSPVQHRSAPVSRPAASRPSRPASRPATRGHADSSRKH